MGKIFAGLIFILFNYNITLGEIHVIGLLPNFVGCILIAMGIGGLKIHRKHFEKAAIANFLFGIYWLLTYILDINIMEFEFGAFSYVAGILSTVGVNIIIYFIVRGVMEIETEYKTAANGDMLYRVWVLKALIDVLLYVSLLVPALIAVFMVSAIMAAAVFLVQFYRAKTMLEGVLPKRE